MTFVVALVLRQSSCMLFERVSADFESVINYLLVFVLTVVSMYPDVI